MPNKLYDVTVNEITLCKSPAVGKATFVLLKSEDATVPDGKVAISKAIVFKAQDVEKQIVYGYPLVPDEVDVQGDVITTEEIEKTAHRYLEVLAKGQAIGTGTGLEHKFFGDGIGYPVESVVDRDGSVAKSMGVAEDQCIPGGWFVGLKVTDQNIWKSIKDGEITGFSIGGHGSREAVKSKSAFSKAIESISKMFTKKPVYKSFNAAIGTKLAKSEDFNDMIEDSEAYAILANANYVLFDSNYYALYSDEPFSERIEAMTVNASQFVTYVNSLKTKLTKSENGDSAMTQEQLDKLNTSLENLTKAVEDLKKKEEPPAPPAPVEKKEDDPVTKAISALAQQVTDLTAKVETIGKNAAGPRVGEEGSAPTKPTAEETLSKTAKNPSEYVEKGGLAGTALSFRPVTPSQQ